MAQRCTAGKNPGGVALGKESSHRREDTGYSSGMQVREDVVSVACRVSSGGTCTVNSNWKVQTHFSILPWFSSDSILFPEILYQPAGAPECLCSRALRVASGWAWETEITSFCGSICRRSILFLLWLYDCLGLGGRRRRLCAQTTPYI